MSTLTKSLDQPTMTYKKLRRLIRETVDIILESPEVLPAPVKRPTTVPEPTETPKKKNPLQPPKEAPDTRPKNQTNNDAVIQQTVRAMVRRFEELKKKNLTTEALEYKDIFGQEALQKLSAESRDNLDRVRREFNYGPDFMMVSMQLMQRIMPVEMRHKTELEQLAVQIVTENFPIVKYAGIKIHASLEPENMGNMHFEESEDDDDDDIDIPEYDQFPEVKKRRIINALTQGAATQGMWSYKMYEEALRRFSPELKEQYTKLMEVSTGVYDDERLIAQMMAMLGSAKELEKQSGGLSMGRENKETGELEIHAKAVIFPLLIHEIVKGLYEIVSLQGFGGSDKEMNKFAMQRADKIDYEIEDLRYGKYIYKMLNAIYAESPAHDPRSRELFFAEVYKLPPDEFISLIDSIIAGKISRAMKQQLFQMIENIESELA